MVDLQKTYAISGDALARKVGDELVIMDLAGEEYFSLNQAGRKVWEGLSQQQTLSVVVDALVEQFDVSRETAAHDVLAVTRELLSAGLVVE